MCVCKLARGATTSQLQLLCNDPINLEMIGWKKCVYQKAVCMLDSMVHGESDGQTESIIECWFPASSSELPCYFLCRLSLCSLWIVPSKSSIFGLLLV